MKNKKIIAITLCIGLVVSSFGGYVTGYSKNEDSKFTAKEYDSRLDNSGVEVLPSQNLVKLAPEVTEPEKTVYDKAIITSNEGEILYKGTMATLDPNMPDMYNLEEKEIKSMMEKGYSVEDIFEADKISNEIGIEPEALLEKKDSSNKSLEQIKKDVLDENKKKTFTKLKATYKTEYEKLKNKKIGEDEIMNLLAYADINKVKITDTMLATYRKEGEKFFQKATTKTTGSQLSQNKKAEYQLTDTEASSISDETLSKLEALSQKTGKPVKELVKAYMKGISSMKK